LRLFSFGGCGLALAALALMVFGAVECPPFFFVLIAFFAWIKFLFLEQRLFFFWDLGDRMFVSA